MWRKVGVGPVLGMVLSCGCSFEQADKPQSKVFGKRTQEIGEFDPNAGAAVQSNDVHITNPVTGPLEAYGPMVGQVATLAIQQAVQFFEAEKGRYPKDHEEFMHEIVRANNIRLPVLPGGKKYQYDVAEHKLVIVAGDPVEKNGKPEQPVRGAE